MSAGVYIARDASGAVLYVGSAGDLEKRLRQHATQSPWWSSVADVERRGAPSRAAAYDVERELIRELQPLHNRRGLHGPKCASRVPEGTPVIKPRLDAWAEVIEEYGTEPALCKALGFDRQTFSNVKRGAYFPSSKFIAAALTGLPGRSFDELFYVGVRDASQESAA